MTKSYYFITGSKNRTSGQSWEARIEQLHHLELSTKNIYILYCSYEQKGKFIKQVKAQKLWFAILESQIETGTPYMLYKDSCNRKSNQKVTEVISLTINKSSIQ